MRTFLSKNMLTCRKGSYIFNNSKHFFLLQVEKLIKTSKQKGNQYLTGRNRQTHNKEKPLPQIAVTGAINPNKEFWKLLIHSRNLFVFLVHLFNERLLFIYCRQSNFKVRTFRMLGTGYLYHFLHDIGMLCSNIVVFVKVF